MQISRCKTSALLCILLLFCLLFLLNKLLINNKIAFPTLVYIDTSIQTIGWTKRCWRDQVRQAGRRLSVCVPASRVENPSIKQVNEFGISKITIIRSSIQDSYYFILLNKKRLHSRAFRLAFASEVERKRHHPHHTKIELWFYF